MIREVPKKQTSDFSDLDKAFKVYLRKIVKPSSDKTKTEDISFSDFFENKILIINAIREGIPYDLFDKIKDVTPFTEDDWATYLNVSKKTLMRHRNETDFSFKPIHTEKIIELAEVTRLGKEVFDSTEQFYLWLNTPSFALGNLNPAELLKDSYGKEMVMNELNRIEHGIFA